MKGLKTFLATALLMFACGVTQAKVKVVNVAVPGTLEQLVGQKNRYRIKEMRVSGRLNATDMLFIADMAGRDHVRRRATEGQLRKLDLRSVVLQPGTVPYGKSTITQQDSTMLIGGIFSDSRLEDVVLPRTASNMGYWLFCNSALRRVVLPDNAEIGDSAFVRCRQLKEVVFPEFTRVVGVGCFNGCDALRSLRMHNVGYISSGAIDGMASLETLSIDGMLGHINGKAFACLPRLRSISFGGDMLSTGGPVVAQNCPLLSAVTFDGMGVQCGFSESPGCPMLKKCSGDGLFMFSWEKCYWKYLYKKVETLSGQQKKEMADKMEAMLAQPWLDRVPFVDGDLYNAACFFSYYGDRMLATKVLSRAIDCGYANYRGTLADTDFDNIRDTEEFAACMKRLREMGDYIYLLQKSAPYATGSDSTGRHFTYALPTDSNLVRVRQYFRLDSIAGNGDEISKMKRIMLWLHDKIRHDGGGGIPQVPRNAIALYEACKKQERGLNCRGLAIMLSEMYMAMGWPSRFLTCESKMYGTDHDCHVINMVWSSELGKWVWMDPTFNAFVTDENGLLLHPGEVRQRIAGGLPLILNDDANWNNRQKQTKEEYLDSYMAKNLYIISAYIDSGFGTEGSTRGGYVTLVPSGFNAPDRNCVSDDAWFWQSPKE